MVSNRRIPVNFKDIDCDVCDKRDIQQGEPPAHRNYQGASVNACVDCARKIDEEEAREKARQERNRRRQETTRRR